MTGNEFDSMMNVVYARWNAKSYPEPVRNRIWYFVKDLPIKSFESIIYALIDVSRYAPMPHEFKMLAYAEKDRLGISKNVEPESKPWKDAACKSCLDSGNLFIIRLPEYESWAKWGHGVVRCDCIVGRKRPACQGSIWNSVIEKSYKKFCYAQGEWAQ